MIFVRASAFNQHSVDSIAQKKKTTTVTATDQNGKIRIEHEHHHRHHHHQQCDRNPTPWTAEIEKKQTENLYIKLFEWVAKPKTIAFRIDRCNTLYQRTGTNRAMAMANQVEIEKHHCHENGREKQREIELVFLFFPELDNCSNANIFNKYIYVVYMYLSGVAFYLYIYSFSHRFWRILLVGIVVENFNDEGKKGHNGY